MSADPVDIYNYKVALRLIESQRRLLYDAHADKGVLKAYEAILKFLYKLPPSQLDRLLGRSQLSTKVREQQEHLASDVAEIALPELEALLADDTVSRSVLEAIAVGRFKVPRGSLKSIGNLDQLKELILSFVSNEKTHQSISEVARDHGR